MFVCENGHYLGKKVKACVCGGKVEAGHKVSLFLPDSLYRALSADAKAMDESISSRVVAHVQRDRVRKKPRKAAKGA